METEPLPIYAFAIEHPEGVIVVDTGERSRRSEPGYFPRWQPFFRFAVREHVEPEQEIGPQLEQLGIPPSDVRRVVMTHLHTDHAGGLHHFPDNEILVSTAELDYAAGLVGRLRGYPNKRWPAWFRPTLIDLPAAPFGPGVGPDEAAERLTHERIRATQPRRAPSTCRRMTPRRLLGWPHASRSVPRGRR